ncbi:MAG: hypothetical protein HY868_03115 [Chloroflexi bacterium]|nr:hypothetical protein [Chloroflexota bacterium]
MPSTKLDLLVHSTHEAGWKVGGIGAVLDGLLSQPAYNQSVKRTILVGSFHQHDALEHERLYAPRNGFKVRFSSFDHVFDVSASVRRALAQVELSYHVHVLYGTRKFGAYEHEIILVDPSAVDLQSLANFKYYLWQQSGVNSFNYEWSSEYDWYMRAAEPCFAALQAVVGARAAKRRAVLIAHDWLGLPLAFSARQHQPAAYRLVYYAHEVSAARGLVEWHPGHDTRFYNTMNRAREFGLALEDVFGSQRDSFKHALLMAADGFDSFFAVSDLTMDELRFLSPAFSQRPLALVYNGIPGSAITTRDKQMSKTRLRAYANTLLEFKPTWVFTHVTRLIPSKSLWRDLRVMEQLDRLLRARGESAVLLTLATSSPAGKRSEDVLRWEAEYGWPLHHRADNGDLVSFEVDYYNAIEQFNRTARASKIVLINQFGWGRERCGMRMPKTMEFADLRHGSDLEFGQSIYEPFGIGQLEPLATGALCCVSNVCGCLGFLKQVNGLNAPNVVVADYVTLPAEWGTFDLHSLLNLAQRQRDEIEMRQAAIVAQKIIKRLPHTSAARKSLLEQGLTLSQQMSWQVVVEQGLLPALQKLFD